MKDKLQEAFLKLEEQQLQFHVLHIGRGIYIWCGLGIRFIEIHEN